MSGKPSFFAELKRRNVHRAAVFYAAGAWLLAQVAGLVLPTFAAPEWALRWIILALAIGLPFWLAFAWAYEITPEGIKRESDVEAHESITHQTGRKLDRWIFAVMGLAIVLLLTDRFVLRRETSSTSGAAATISAAIPAIETDPSIAVLPLVNMSSDKEQEYFSDGISEELLNLLAKVPKLRVIARTSSFGFKGKDTPIAEIARQLHVASVLEGSVRKSGDKVRITAQLIRASDGSHLWSDTYDRTLDDIFKVQDEIAAAVVEQLRVKLLGAVPTAKPVDAKVYPLILQGQALVNQGSAASRAQAIMVFQQALSISPNEARAWVGLMRAYFNQVVYGERPSQEGARLINEVGKKALASDPGNADVHALLGRVAADIEFDLATGARYYQRALDLEPGNLTVLNAAAILFATTGRMDEARELMEYRVAHDPANPISYNNLATSLYNAKRWDAAIDAWQTALRLSPDYSTAHFGIGSVLLLGKHDAAGALKEFEAEPDELTRMQGHALALHALGRTKEADATLQAFVGKYGKEQPETVATLHAWRGNLDAAFDWMDKAVAIHDVQLGVLVSEPLLDSMRSDPRWLPLLRQLGYAPEQLAKIDLKVTPPQ